MSLFKHHIPKFCKETLFRMRDSVPTIVTYAKAELTPPKPSELREISPAIRHILSQYRSGGWKSLSIKEAWLNVLVVTEITMWFFIGEIIGKGQLVGYPLKL